MIAMAVSFGPTASAPATGTGTVEADGAPVEFATQACGPYEGMPLFDGNPDHLDRYLEVFFEYAGPEGIARWALQQRGDYTLRSGPHAGRVIPGRNDTRTTTRAWQPTSP